MARAGFDDEKTPIVQLAAYAPKAAKARLTIGALASLVGTIGAILAGGLLVLDRFYASRTELAVIEQRLDAAGAGAAKTSDDHEHRIRTMERVVTRTDANLEILMRRMGAQPLPPAEIERAR